MERNAYDRPVFACTGISIDFVLDAVYDSRLFPPFFPLPLIILLTFFLQPPNRDLSSLILSFPPSISTSTFTSHFNYYLPLQARRKKREVKRMNNQTTK